MADFYSCQHYSILKIAVPHDFKASLRSEGPQVCIRCKKNVIAVCLTCHFCQECHNAAMVDSEYEKHDKITEATLKPVTKVKSELDKELQEWEVESTKDGQDSQGNG